MCLLQIKQIEKSKGNTIVFPKIDLDIHKEEIVAIQCNHEVGKQLIMMIIGETPISNGEVLLEGLPINHHFKSLSNRVGLFLLDEAMYERLTPKEYLNFYKRLYDVDEEINSLLQKVGLIEKVKSKISKLTYSEKKRLQLARAILHLPGLLIMEEPDQNIDIESKIIMQRVLEDFKGQGKAVLITTNNFESAISMTNTVYRLNEVGLKKIDVVDEEKGTLHAVSIDDQVIDSPPTIVNEEIENSTAEEANEGKEKAEEEATIIHRPLRIEKIPAKVEDKMILFDPTEIVFVESNEGISHLHVNGEVFPCSITLNDLSERLRPFGFFRCHRSYIVNLQKVREVITWTRNSYSLILEDSKKSPVPLSKGKLNELKVILGI
ncbi:LytTR family transcriptional regulator DNA-binding domain-containing protein [Heyndrickxia vini]|uniref:LytTR family transcriptional regulator DNA-binding domain-containing protein n=1 Tax=Heyndrickxia vini TaxID=1476025 RepID=A0ABX7E1P8_9BACI|nr:LytTR family transcriptional regulator DNA-binding domain-containing protein [Heyndrickxia vini]QQZ09653.1 LytTR family transcriptional regulator DNA-binding domain-containing protein [Heyndrickxia vini]